MKDVAALLLVIILFSCAGEGQEKESGTVKKPLRKLVINQQDISRIKLDYCDSLSIEFTGLYPILDSLPAHTTERLKTKTLLTEAGFEQTNYGWGNWPRGPRFVYMEYKKGDCTCKLYKKYYFLNAVEEGNTKLQVTERIICNADEYMDE